MISEAVVTSELKVVKFFLKCSKFAGDQPWTQNQV
jgi:hypothetical protein